MSKPSWTDAPPWANYLAMNSDNVWYWYKEEPYLDKYVDYWRSCGKEVCALDVGMSYNAVETKEERP